MSCVTRAFCLAIALAACWQARSQTAPNASQVLLYSALSNQPGAGAVANVYSYNGPLATVPQAASLNLLTNPTLYKVNDSFIAVSSALNASIATSLSLIPLSSPASGIVQTIDPATGA